MDHYDCQPKMDKKERKRYLRNIAETLFPNIKNYPLEKEIVFILSLPGTNLQEDLGDIIHYYFSPINIWQSVHQNALPDNVFQSSNQSSNSKTNQEVLCPLQIS